MQKVRSRTDGIESDRPKVRRGSLDKNSFKKKRDFTRNLSQAHDFEVDPHTVFVGDKVVKVTNLLEPPTGHHHHRRSSINTLTSEARSAQRVD